MQTDDPAAVTRLLAREDVWVTELAPDRQDLESYVLSLTAGEGLADRDQERAS